MARMAETALQEGIQKMVEKHGGYVIKQHGSMISAPGIPDLLICYKGLFIAFEVKTPIGKASEQQKIHARNIVKAGGYIRFPRSVAEAEHYLLEAAGEL